MEGGGAGVDPGEKARLIGVVQVVLDHLGRGSLGQALGDQGVGGVGLVGILEAHGAVDGANQLPLTVVGCAHAVVAVVLEAEAREVLHHARQQGGVGDLAAVLAVAIGVGIRKGNGLEQGA